uniref:Uncharacterized protein n=1 Tax=Thermococcus aciditolerans TaxID=2598455 RepID=A0A5C0SP11_9EURY|nr:hypothetical protein FPV09_10715 [Thermococcus aciditolerans]
MAFTIARYHYGVFFTLDFLMAMLVVFLVLLSAGHMLLAIPTIEKTFRSVQGLRRLYLGGRGG